MSVSGKPFGATSVGWSDGSDDLVFVFDKFADGSSESKQWATPSMSLLHAPLQYPCDGPQHHGNVYPTDNGVECLRRLPHPVSPLNRACGLLMQIQNGNKNINGVQRREDRIVTRLAFSRACVAGNPSSVLADLPFVG